MDSTAGLAMYWVHDEIWRSNGCLLQPHLLETATALHPRGFPACLGDLDVVADLHECVAPKSLALSPKQPFDMLTDAAVLSDLSQRLP